MSEYEMSIDSRATFEAENLKGNKAHGTEAVLKRGLLFRSTVRKRGRKAFDLGHPFFYLAPSILFLLFVYAGPFVFNLYISLTDWTGIGFQWNFTGFRNYRELFGEKRIGQVLLNNLVYLFFLVFIQNVFAILLALLLNKEFRLRNFFRSLLFMPTVIATVAVGFIWSLMFDPVNGPLPILSRQLNLPFLSEFSWLGDSNRAIYLVIFVSMWQWTSWNMIIYLAGIQGIPKEMYESSDIDGAKGLIKLKAITLPLLRPAVTVNLILSTISVLKFFDLPYVLTKGGPGYATETLAITLYSYTFLYNKLGYGTAISLVLFTAVMLITILQLSILKKGEEDLAG